MVFPASHTPLWPVLLPLAGAGLCACLWNHRRAQRAVSGATTALLLLASLLLIRSIPEGGALVTRFGDWDAPFGIVFVADRLAGLMVALSGILAAVASLFGLADIRRREERSGFHPLFMGLMAGVNGAFLTGDIFNLYVWFEVTLIAAMGLLALGGRPSRIDGTIRYGVLNLFSTLLFLSGVALLYGAAGTLNMADLARVLPDAEPTPGLSVAALFLFCGFAVKAGLFPLFFWLPASYHTASITVAAVFAGLLTKVAIYASFRVFTLLFSAQETGIADITLVMAILGMVLGVFGAASQWDMRRILAFHSVSQFGYMIAGLALGTPAAFGGAIFYILHHSIVKANLFLVAGAIHRANGSFDLRNCGGLLKADPALAVLFLVPALSLAGIPPLSGFWAKVLIVGPALEEGAFALAGTMLFTGVLTLYSMVKIWDNAFWRPSKAGRPPARPVPAPMLLAISTLSGLALVIGLWPEPLIRASGLAGAALVDPAAALSAVLAGGQP